MSDDLPADFHQQLKLLSDTQQKHLLSRLKNQHEHKKAIEYVRSYKLDFISAMCVGGG
tara:strand:- start:591 stop:764 length:174 start_codon:yes stop_codon:yes gene_type:complete